MHADAGADHGVLYALAAYTIVAHEPFGVSSNPKWLGAKVARYATAIACGLGIRLTLRGFGAPYGALMSTGSMPEVECALRRAVACPACGASGCPSWPPPRSAS